MVLVGCGGFGGRWVGYGGVVYLVCSSVTLAHVFYVNCKLVIETALGYWYIVFKYSFALCVWMGE